MEKVFLFTDKQSNTVHFSFSEEIPNKGLCSVHVGNVESMGFDIANKDFVFIQNFENQIFELMKELEVKDNLVLCEKCLFILNKKVHVVKKSSVTIDGSIYQLKFNEETYPNIPATLPFKTSNEIRGWIARNIRYSNLELKRNPIAKIGKLVFEKAIGDARNIHLGF